MSAAHCPCGIDSTYEECCGRFLAGKANPATAEALMRSRYSAYVKHALNYLVETTHPSSRDDSLLTNITSTANSYTWLSLQIAGVQGGSADDNVGKVEFLAHFRSREGRVGIHHERSRFRKYAGKWMYVDGEVM